MITDMTHPESKIIDMLWEEQMTARRPLINTFDGDFAAFVTTLPDLHEAFYRTSDGVVVPEPAVKCIDEGTDGGVRVAGVGVLMSLDKIVAALEGLQIEVVHSHDGCGAAALAATQTGTHVDDPDKLGQEFAAKVAKRLGARHHHIRREQLRRPQNMHVATVVYYSGVKAFNPALSDKLPNGFTITRALHAFPPPAQKEADIACQIAFGAHGFDERFTSAHPLIIVPIGNPHRPELSVEALTAELQPVLNTYGDRVMIAGFT